MIQTVSMMGSIGRCLLERCFLCRRVAISIGRTAVSQIPVAKVSFLGSSPVSEEQHGEGRRSTFHRQSFAEALINPFQTAYTRSGVTVAERISDIKRQE